jgi:hypothetical protein
MRYLACLVLLAFSTIAYAQTAPYTPGAAPSCLPNLNLSNVHTASANGLVQTLIWCPIAGAQIGYWTFGGSLTEALTPACIASIFGLNTPNASQQMQVTSAWAACVDRAPTAADSALAQGLVDTWVPRVTVTGGASSVYIIDVNGRIYPYILANVQQTVTMPNAKGAHCGGPGYNDSHGNHWYSMAGLTTDQGNAMQAPATPTTNRLDFAAKCTISYPPATGWTN